MVREAITRNSPIETQYYSSVLVHFPQVCYYCGLSEETLVDDEQIKELRTHYSVVLPLCFVCRSEGKKPFCRMPSDVAKKRKTSIN